MDICFPKVYKKRTNKVLTIVIKIMANTPSSSKQSSVALFAPIMVEASASGVKCNGGNPALGHPEVYYSFDEASEVTCGYCGQVFSKLAK